MDYSEYSLEKIKKIEKARKLFLKSGKIDLSFIRTVIADSWKRCRTAKVNPNFCEPIHLNNEKKIKSLLEKNRHLIKISQPLLEMARIMIEGTGFRIDLSDKNGYIIELIGDSKILEESKEIGVVIGANRSEMVVGTNSIGLALITGKPVQVIGPEHYCLYPCNWTCSAAPIKDPTDNIIIGTVNMSGRFHLMHKHTLGMVVGIANAIDNAIKIEAKVEALKINNQLLHTIIESITDGLIVLNNKGEIVHLNSIAEAILGIESSEAIGKLINSVVKTNFSFIDVFNSRQKHTEQEIIITPFSSKEKLHYYLTTEIIENSEGKTQGLTALFKEMRKVHRLIGNYISSIARYTFLDIIGNNKTLIETINLAKATSNSDCKVLICGESGTGKEMIAQAIHNNSNRKNKPFIAINCAAIPKDLIESELFGYDEGAFTGARRGGKIGKFELANGGTIFLDEIGSMPIEAQPKLLRVLETNQLSRVGGNEFIPVNVRIISATNRDLKQMIGRNSFREDLYYRLSTIIVNIPSLRERRDDIPVLVDYICKKIGKRSKKSGIKVDHEVLELFCNYSWPGNFRELENTLESAILLSKGHYITTEVIPDHIKYCKNDSSNIENRNTIKINSLNNVEKETILGALKETRGNLSKASRILEIDRSTLYRKVKKYKINEKSFR